MSTREHKTPRRTLAAGTALVMALAGFGLAGCTGGQDDLRQWMAAERARVKPNIPPIEPPGVFDPEPYAVGQMVDPFSTQKMAVALRQEATQPSSLLAGELNRRREPLEAFPLDNMTMVGSVTREGRPFALLRIGTLLYQVGVGNYLGQNYGRIMSITETEITLREIVQDAAGEWIERPTTLALQEAGRR